MPAKVVRSVCPYDCPDTCGLLVEVDGERAVKIAGDPEHPHTGGFLCRKMNRYEKTVHSSRRLTEPLLRTGEKGSGQFEPLAWSDAIEIICQRWRDIIARHGAEAILPYSYAGTMGLVQRNAGHPFFHRLGASLLDRTICTSAKGAGWNAVMGKTPAPHPRQVELSDMIVIWGSNTLATSLHTVPGIRKARADGAKVWLIETYETPTATLADRTVLVRPGTDAALALGLMHLLVRDQLVDSAFLAENTAGFNDLKETILPDYPPQRVAELTGVDIPTLTALSRAFGRANAPYIILGSGLSRYANGAMSTRCIVTLPTLVGAYGKPGAGCFAGTSTGAAFNMDRILRPDFLDGSPRTINMNQLGDALTEPCEPPISSLYVYHSNPAVVAPDQNRVLRGLARDDLFTVVHERFMTDTARYADIVLPACTSLETADIYRSYGHYGIQRCRPVIPAVGQSKSNWDTFALLAEGMGFDDPFFRQSAEDLITRLLDDLVAKHPELDRSLLDEGKAVELATPATDRFVTPSGKIEILNHRLEEPLPRYLPPQRDSFPLQLMTPPALQTLNSSFMERDDLRAGTAAMALQMNPRDASERDLQDGRRVCAFNRHGTVTFVLAITDRVPAGVVVAEGVWWIEFAPGERSVNALISQRLSDLGGGSTFYDNRVEVKAEE